MLVQLKSNKTEHEIPKATWDKMPEQRKRNYTVINKADTVSSKQVVENTSTGKEKKKDDKSESGSATA